jgi:hypothetical protein
MLGIEMYKLNTHVVPSVSPFNTRPSTGAGRLCVDQEVNEPTKATPREFVGVYRAR